MDRQENKPIISTEVKGALIAVAIIGAATAPIIFTYKDKYLAKSPETPTPTPVIVDTEAARRRMITGGLIASPDIPASPTPKPSPSPHISYD